MMAFPRMAVSQVLVRRHRTRDGQEDASPAPASSNGNANVEGVDEEAHNVDASSARRDLDPSNANNNSSTSTTGGSLSAGESHDGEQELVVQVPNSWQQSASIPPSFVLPPMAWEPSEEATALRRDAIHREVERVQRANFIHFLVLCLVPTALLVIVIAAIVSEDGDCGSGGDELMACEMEPRSFANAFTTTCICDAVRIAEGEVSP